MPAVWLGNDGSGNNNYWAPTNFSLTLYSNYDSMVDVPGIASTSVNTDSGNLIRGNYNTWNPLTNTRSGGTITQGNLVTSGALNTRPLMLGTQYFNSGKWYCEVWCGAYGSSGDNKPVGITTIRGQTDVIGSSTLLTYGSGVMRAFANSNDNSLDFRNGFGTTTDQGTGTNWWQDGFWIGFAVDVDNDIMAIYKNGVLGARVTNCGLKGKEWTYFWEPESSSSRTPATNWYWNFGQQPFVYTPPAGHKGLCTSNLPTPIIKRPSDHFDVKTWTGNGGELTVGTTAKQTSTVQILKSLRFRNSSVSGLAYLERTPAISGNRKTWTYSTWVKQGDQGGIGRHFGMSPQLGGDGANESQMNWQSDGSIRVYDAGGVSGYFNVSTVAKFKSPDVWYHIVVAVDTTQIVTNERVKIYVNGVKQPLTITAQVNLNQNTGWNHTYRHRIGLPGYSTNAAQGWDGYLAEINHIDGQALTPTSFGQFDANNNWVPKTYTGTYGTNGFRLPSTNLGGLSAYVGGPLSNSNYLTAPTNAAFNIGTSNFTMETWFYPTSTSQTGQFFYVASGGIQMGYLNSSNWGLCHANVAWQTTTSTLPTTGAWNHMAICRSGTGTNQTALFLNGVRVAQGTISTSYSQNTCAIGQGIIGYMTNTRMVKGTAVYDPANSTYTVPTAPLTNITNTSLLTFQNSSAIDNSSNALTLTTTGTVAYPVAYPFTTAANGLGADSSGNSNNWTTINISNIQDSTYDSMFDSPVDTTDSSGNIIGNYTTLNLYNTGGGSTTLTNGNLSCTAASTGTYAKVLGTLPLTTGKWYWETTIDLVGSAATVGIGDGTAPSASTGLGGAPGEISYVSTGNTYRNAVSASYGASYTTGDVIGVAYDADVGSITFYKNNASQGTVTGFSGTKYPAVGSSGGTSPQYTVNFGQRGFIYTPPTGFKAINTKNLKDVGSYNLPDTFGNFVNTPDLVWLKASSSASYGHRLTDTVRGPTRQLLTHDTGAQSTDVNGLQTFLPNGFVVGSGGDYNTAGQTYASWNWNRGKIPGFDIVTWSGTGAELKVRHNLGVTPSWIVNKSLNNISGWNTYHSGIGPTGSLNLQTTAVTSTTIDWWRNTPPTSTEFTVGANFPSNWSFVSYLWAEVPGFSKFGAYTNNNSTDGTFIYTGFRPKFVLIKNYDNVEEWYILDSVRQTYNQAPPMSTSFLKPNSASASSGSSSSGIDLMSNGFKIRTTNPASGEIGFGTRAYIYCAFADVPFKYANAR